MPHSCFEKLPIEAESGTWTLSVCLSPVWSSFRAPWWRLQSLGHKRSLVQTDRLGLGDYILSSFCVLLLRPPILCADSNGISCALKSITLTTFHRLYHSTCSYTCDVHVHNELLNCAWYWILERILTRHSSHLTACVHWCIFVVNKFSCENFCWYRY